MFPLAIPSWNATPDDAARVLATIEAWAGSVSLEHLVRAFGASAMPGPPAERLGWLDEFAAKNWDFRGGLERNLSRQFSGTPGQVDALSEVSAALGLANRETPLRDDYDTVVMTGGMVRAGIVKPRFVAGLLDSGLQTRHVVFLGGFRPFAGDEEQLAARLGVDGHNEFDAMCAGVQRAFGPLGEPSVSGDSAVSNASWRELTWTVRGLRLSVIAAPSSQPELRRANSADTYRFWAEHRRGTSDVRILQVTTPIYVPYQATAAVEILGLEHGLAVETIGVSAQANDLGEHTQQFTTAHHLQELRAAIGAMARLHMRLERHIR